MTKNWLSLHRARRSAISAAVFCVVITGGCKTGDDAKAAATQLAATAKCLSDYYSALATILTETDSLNSVEPRIALRPPVAAVQQQ